MRYLTTIKPIIAILSIVIFALACKNKPIETEKPLAGKFVSDLKVATNYVDSVLFLDYSDAINGFVIPSIRQTKNGYFNFSFSLKNKSDQNKSFYYKIYYQNESYKFPETTNESSSREHEYAHENFYGSWEETEIGFKSVKSFEKDELMQIVDSFRIVGNPRNEEKFFWEGENDRWKRNPRLGDYSFLLVVVDESELEKIPDYIKNINLQNKDKFVSPYFYFLHGEGSKLEMSDVVLVESFINIKASPDLGAGVYINESLYETRHDEDFRDLYSCNCSNNDELYKKASIEQFIHYIDESSKFFNVPVIEDFFDGNFTQEEYNWLRAFYKKEDRIAILPKTPQKPCETIFSDSLENKIVIKNPAAEYGNWQKQNTGMITRHGFTYGKYTVKANLTELLNDDYVWNGITNAIWMIYQGGRGSDQTGWNLRRACKEKGYMKTYWGGRLDDRVEQVAYSEIDFEILKTVPYCPESKYPPVYENYEAKVNKVNAWNVRLPEDLIRDKKNIAVCCTNWDMACWEPKNFSSGCHSVSHNGKTYLAHRWEDCYRAVTTKYMAPDDELFGRDYYYFQIDWQPDKIIWRIGPEKNELYEVGYVDNTISAIPDNQMLLIITQEFHNTNWWPGSPFNQENIPFPAKDYVGEIYEIIIE